jgi:hypothetical protein
MFDLDLESIGQFMAIFMIVCFFFISLHKKRLK